MTHAAVREHERGPERRRIQISGEELHLDRLANHVGIVNAAPEMGPIGHVTVLTMLAGRRLWALRPLDVGVLDRLAVRRDRVKELVAHRAEAALQKLRPLFEPPVRKRLGKRRQPRPARRPVTTVEPHMTGRAEHTLASQAGIERGLGVSLRRDRLLLSERRVAALASPQLARRSQLALDELSREARAERRGVQTGAPLGELLGVASPTDGGIERSLGRARLLRWLPLRGHRKLPVGAQKRPENALELAGGRGLGRRDRERAPLGLRRARPEQKPTREKRTRTVPSPLGLES